MKKYKHIYALLVTLLFLLGCKKALKNMEDYYPKVNTVSATVNADGTVEVIADIESEGAGQLEYIGFCMDTLPVPDMLKNQMVVNELKGTQFNATYSLNFNPGKTYYFRSWATNSNGYSYGNVQSLSNIKATPVAAPCSLSPNTSGIGLNGNTMGSVYDVTGLSQSLGAWGLTAYGYDSNAGTLKFSFGSALKTKIYTTTSDSPFGDLVSIYVSSGFTSGVVNSGAKVYVNQLSPGVFEITVCEATWTPSGFSGTYNLKARFISPL